MIHVAKWSHNCIQDVEEVEKEVIKIFNEIQQGPVDALKDEVIIDSFKQATSAQFCINVVATMSAGKSTLINALLGKKLMPMAQMATTATIVRIIAKNSEYFSAVAKDKEDKEVACEANNFTNACAGINASNLHEYLNRDDVLYIDLRDYVDYGDKHLRNFEVVPYFAYIFNANAGTEGNPQLFGGTVAAPVATYEESVEIMEVLFPKDKTIFLMCQGGGRVAQAMTLLEALGWDMTKIYNVGGMGQYTEDLYGEWTSNAAELSLEATYGFEGLTPVK